LLQRLTSISLPNQRHIVVGRNEMDDFESMPLGELWELHEQIRSLLTSRLEAQKHRLEERIDTLNGGGASQGALAKPKSDRSR
jgi:hypothetical protein